MSNKNQLGVRRKNLLRQVNLAIRHILYESKHLLYQYPCETTHRTFVHLLILLRILVIPARILYNPFYARFRSNAICALSYPSHDVFVGVSSTSPAHSSSSHNDVNVNIKMSRWIYHVINCFLCGKCIMRSF